MRHFLDELRNGLRATGVLSWCFGEPYIPLIFKNAGLDCLFIDMEHSCFGYETVQTMVQASRSCGLFPFVRVPKVDKECLQKVWDMGAGGVVVPIVEASAQAREFVMLSKYPPIGKRGMGPGLGHNDFKMDIPLADYMKEANEQLILLVQPETKIGARNLEEILSVEGISGIFTGPYDLSASLGIPGQFDNPEFKAVYEGTVATALAMGKIVAGFAGNDPQAERLASMGAHIIIKDTDESLLFKAARASIDKTRMLKGF